mgnify:CR=1 FL=1
MAPGGRPARLVLVAGTATGVGKTWVSATVARELRRRGTAVSARKLAQSHDPADPEAARDASVLASATGELPGEVCPPDRTYEIAMAPPMAAAALGRPALHLAELVAALRWPAGAAVGFVETAGGVRSPQADDGDVADLAALLEPDVVLLVADAGLGTINLVRMSLAALAGHAAVVVLNRFDPGDRLHAANRAWLAERDGFDVVTSTAVVSQRLVAPRRS